MRLTLGQQVQKYLIQQGVETPMNFGGKTTNKKKVIEGHIKAVLETLGLDLTDDSLKDTPRRVAKMYVDEVFYGLDYSKFPKCTAVTNKMAYDEMVVVRNINVQSNCEHHLVVFSGKATVAYIPKDKVLGLSKINRVVEFFAKRPQIQERLTEQVYHALSFILGTEAVAVVIEAEHFCVKSRGIRDVGSSTVTSKLGGVFREPQAKAEFLSLR